MKFYLTRFLFAIIIIGSCTSESEEVQDMIDNTDCSVISFSSDIQPIIQNNCAVSGCHVSNTSQADFTKNEIIESNANSIKSRTSNGTMPPPGSGLTLSKKQIDAIACWVDNGGKIN